MNCLMDDILRGSALDIRAQGLRFRLQGLGVAVLGFKVWGQRCRGFVIFQFRGHI